MKLRLADQLAPCLLASLRSVKVRHDREPLHTVPFGALSAMTNYSRDWVIDKMTLGSTTAPILIWANVLSKKIGRALNDDPEFAPHILEALKMQGVDAFGDFAIQVRLKMMIRTGEQFITRRRAYALIKRAFGGEGIRFAYPTVSVAGGTTDKATTGAVAQIGLDRANTTRQ